jgi:hypothetical protein
MVIFLAIMFAVQGCALYVEDGDGFYHHHHFHHGYRGEEHYSKQTQVAENRMSEHRSSMDAGEK